MFKFHPNNKVGKIAAYFLVGIHLQNALKKVWFREVFGRRRRFLENFAKIRRTILLNRPEDEFVDFFERWNLQKFFLIPLLNCPENGF